MKTPAVTVLMPVYNAEKYLHEAIESVLKQTFIDFEFLIIDDGSEDESEKIIRSFDDPRIVFVKNEKNLGIAKSLNRGVELARGEYVARMDADDISLPERLQLQYEFMRAHPEVGLCGGAVRGFGARAREDRYPEKEEEIRAQLLFNAAFAHPAVMIRRTLLLKKRYREVYEGAEDYDLWTRCVGETGCANLPDFLLLYRHHEKQVSAENQKRQRTVANRVRLEYLRRVHSDFTAEEASVLGDVAYRIFVPYEKVERLLRKIQKCNRGFFDEKTLQTVFARQYWWMLGQNCDKTECFGEFLRFAREAENRRVAGNKGKFILKCLLRWRSE